MKWGEHLYLPAVDTPTTRTRANSSGGQTSDPAEQCSKTRTAPRGGVAAVRSSRRDKGMEQCSTNQPKPTSLACIADVLTALIRMEADGRLAQNEFRLLVAELTGMIARRAEREPSEGLRPEPEGPAVALAMWSSLQGACVHATTRSSRNEEEKMETQADADIDQILGLSAPYDVTLDCIDASRIHHQGHQQGWRPADVLAAIRGRMSSPRLLQVTHLDSEPRIWLVGHRPDSDHTVALVKCRRRFEEVLAAITAQGWVGGDYRRCAYLLDPESIAQGWASQWRCELFAEDDRFVILDELSWFEWAEEGLWYRRACIGMGIAVVDERIFSFVDVDAPSRTIGGHYDDAL